jgi:hypothetical protein
MSANPSSPGADAPRRFEQFFEHEHLLGERIFAAGGAISDALEKVAKVSDLRLDPNAWNPPPPVQVPAPVLQAMGYFVYLLDHFADQVHLRAEESMFDIAVSCGMPRAKRAWVDQQHETARAYWKLITLAYERIQADDLDDRWFAVRDFIAATRAFVFLFQAHAYRENNSTYPTAGQYIDAANDDQVMKLVQQFGWQDVTPFVWMVSQMESLLGIPSPPPG